MQNIERRVWREARAMTRREVITKTITRQLTWVQASEILGISARHMRRLRRKVERWGMSAVMDQRGGVRRSRPPNHELEPVVEHQSSRECRDPSTQHDSVASPRQEEHPAQGDDRHREG